SAGTLAVRGDVAGTSARLQPAEIRIHWERGSLADLLRLFRGRDYGVRGIFALDAVAKSGGSDLAAADDSQPGDWSYSIQARSAQIHRWDLNERSDNPRLNVSVLGRVNVASGEVRATRVVVETAKSNLRGTARAVISRDPSWEIRADSAGVQASDVLAWFRAFHPGVDDSVSVEQYFTGTVTLRGWPFQLTNAAFSSEGGEARIAGLASALRIGPIEGGRLRGALTVDPVRISYAKPAAEATSPAAKRHPAVDPRTALTITLAHDFDKHAGWISLEGHVDRVEDALRVAEAFGRPLNHGWDLTGPMNAAIRCDWSRDLYRPRWNGRLDLAKGELQAAGLNLPLTLAKTRLEWKDGAKSADIGQIEAFGATWTGTLLQSTTAEPDIPAKWYFQLHADHLDAAELDRWIGPRARPSWLRRLLPSLLGRSITSSSVSSASELVRRVNAEGELHVDTFTLEKLNLQKLIVLGMLRDLRLDIRDASAQWAGGGVRARMSASFFPRPAYDISADLDRVDLSKLPAVPRITDRFTGSASGKLHIATQGVGRDELLTHLAGRGDIRVRNLDFRGWDVSATVADGAPHAGQSHWVAGEGTFSLR